MLNYWFGIHENKGLNIMSIEFGDIKWNMLQDYFFGYSFPYILIDNFNNSQGFIV